MMTHLTRNVAAAMTPQSAIAVKQRTQAGEVSTPADSSDQYNFAELFGQASNQQKYVTKAAPGSTAAGAAAALASASAAAATSASTATPSSNTSTPGIEALVSAIMKGTFKSSNVTDPSQLQETTPAGTDTMPNFYYADNQTASELANLLGGSVVQMPAFGQDKGWTEPNANFIELPNGQTFNAADVAYYGRAGVTSAAQLTADITQTINAGAAWTNYYQNGGQIPSFTTGYVGPAISGMAYPTGSVAADGTVINPAMQTSST